jgi:hypothetical protein
MQRKATTRKATSQELVTDYDTRRTRKHNQYWYTIQPQLGGVGGALSRVEHRLFHSDFGGGGGSAGAGLSVD